MVTIIKEGSGYRVDWPEYKVVAIVKHVKDRSTFKAQVAMSHAGNPVHRANPVLDSTSGMDTFARRLEKNLNGNDYGVPWSRVVEDLAGIVIDTHKQGSPEEILGDVEADDTVTWRIDNVLVDGHPNLLWAEGGTGKSMYSLWQAVLIQQGWLDSSHGLVVEPGNVLILDWETDAYEIANRARMIHKGLGIDTPSAITYRACGQPLVDDVDRIKDIVFRRNIDVVIIDSMGLAVGGEMESAENVLAFFRAVRQLEKTALIISHSNRQGTIFGSAYTLNSSRSVWEIKKSESKDGVTAFDLFHRKANNIGLQAAQTWSMAFKDDAVTFTRGDTFKTEASGSLSYDVLVYRILKDGAQTRDYIQDDILSRKNDPVDRVAANVKTAISRHMKTAKELAPFIDGALIEEHEGRLQLVYPVKDDGSWESI